MPISIRYKNLTDQDCIIRPAPLVAINETAIRNKAGILGKNYSITLNGWIIVNQGFPFARNSIGDLFEVFDVNGITKIPIKIPDINVTFLLSFVIFAILTQKGTAIIAPIR